MNLERYVDKMVEVHKSAFSALDAWRKEKQDAKEKLKKEALRLTREAAVEENAKFVREYENKRIAIEGELSAAVAAVEAEYMQEVKAFYAPNGAKIDEADQALLSSGILSTEELVEMIGKHKDNPTMERIINKYIVTNGIKDMPSGAMSALYRATSGGENERRIFNELKMLLKSPVSMAAQGLEDTESFMRTMLKADDYAKEIKLKLMKAKLALTNAEADQLKKVEHEAMVEKNGGYDFTLSGEVK